MTNNRTKLEQWAKLREALWTPGKAAWSGLARDLMLAFDMGCRTPREIFQHLDRCGKPIPQWLRDEGEMKHLDHVPSKGTRAVIIYRAMLEPAMADLYRTGQLVPVQQPSVDEVEAENAKLRGLLQSALSDFRYRVGTIKSPFHWANVAETTLARLDAARGRP